MSSCEIISIYTTCMTNFFLECESLFLRHRKTGKCIAAGDLVYKVEHAKLFFSIMTENCLKPIAQFRYLESELLHNIENNGTLVSPADNAAYKHRWAIYKGIQSTGLAYQNSLIHRLKQTDAGRLLLYNMKEPVCAEPQTTYVIRNKTCNAKIQRFTFGKLNLVC